MKKEEIGFLYSGKALGKEEKLFLKIAKRKRMNLVMINVFKETDRKKIEEKIKNCKLIYNNTAEDFGIELAKTIEIMGKKVIDSPETYYFSEDKWLFYLKCKEHHIPTPDTILLSENIGMAKKELKEFGEWPVILKRVCGTMGEYVEMVKNPDEAETIIKRFWKKGREKLPIIAQEFIDSPSYRVTVIGNKIVQTAIKNNKSGWKSTGVYAKKFEKFKIDSELKKIIKKIISFSKIHICGIDFLKKGNQWLALEINSEPGLDFFEDERKKLLECVLDFLKKEAKNC